MSRARTSATLAAVAGMTLALAGGIRRLAMPAPPSYFVYDQQAYLSMARQPFVNTPAVYAPAGWRVLPPLLARTLGSIAGGGPERGFLILTFGCFALVPIVAFLFLDALGVSTTTALVCAAVVALAPTNLGYMSWDVVRVDPLSLLLLFASGYGVVRNRPALALTAIVALGLTKETVLLGAFFALAWAVRIDPRLLAPAMFGVAAAVAIRGALLPWLIPPAIPFDNLGAFKEIVHDELTIRYALRRLLLATATTWNAILPLAAVWLMGAARRPLGQVLLATIAVAFAQLAFASDTERVMAAAYPYMIAACAFELDRFAGRRRLAVGVALVLAQLPWLCENGRIAHLPWLRGVEIAIVLATVAAMAWRARQPHQPTAAST